MAIGTIAVDTTQVDLDNAETGLWLAEIRDIFGDRLEPLVRERIVYEVHRRVFENYKKGKFWWEAGENNWAAVCGGSVGGALMYLDPELFEELKPRLLKTLDAFIKSFPDDGTCLEGASYCGYGFGVYTIFADLYNRYTKGEDELLQGEKIKNISCYMQRCFLKAQIFDNYIKVGNIKLLFDNKLCKVSLNTGEYTPHGHDKEYATAYLIDFELASGLSDISFKFEV